MVGIKTSRELQISNSKTEISHDWLTDVAKVQCVLG